MGRTASRELNELRRRLATWRKQDGGGRGSRIPDELWNDAVRVAEVDGMWATARALHFNYQRLKERATHADGGARVEGRSATARGTASARSPGKALDGVSAVGEVAGPTSKGRVAGSTSAGRAFIELLMGEASGAGKTVIEFVGRRGERMRVEVTGNVDLVGLARTFWGQP